MTYLYQGLAGSKFTTRCSPRTYEEREAAIRKNIEWETGGIARGVERYRNEMAKDIAKEGASAPASGLGFASSAEMISAMSDPKYKSDPAFRNQVRLRVGRSNFELVLENQTGV